MDTNSQTVRDRIIKEATIMFIEHGCKQVKMDTIAKKIGISKRTIYENFTDKKDLLSECIAMIIKSIKDFEKQILDYEKPESFVEWLKKLSSQPNNLMFDVQHCFSDDIKKYYPDIFKKYFADHDKQRLNTLRAIINKAEKNGYLREHTDTKLVVSFVDEMTKQIYFNKISLSPKYTKKQLFVHFFSTYFRGIASEKVLSEMKTFHENKNKNKNKKQ